MIGVFRADWRPQLTAAKLGPLAPAGGGTVLPTTAAGTIAQNPAAHQRTAFNTTLLRAVGMAVFAVAAAVPPSSNAIASARATNDFTPYQFEIGSEYATLDLGQDVIVGPDRQSQPVYSVSTKSYPQLQQSIAALIGNVASSPYQPPLKDIQPAALPYPSLQIVKSNTALLPVGGGAVTIGSVIPQVAPVNYGFAAQQSEVSLEYAPLISGPAPAYVPPSTVARADALKLFNPQVAQYQTPLLPVGGGVVIPKHAANNISANLYAYHWPEWRPPFIPATLSPLAPIGIAFQPSQWRTVLVKSEMRTIAVNAIDRLKSVH